MAEEKPQKIKSITFHSFREILDIQKDKGFSREEVAESAKWFFNKAKQIRGATPSDMMSESSRLKSRITIGKMYCMYYDPKWKDKLPFYDTFPMFFPYQTIDGGFTGINIHYLPPVLRIALMEALYDLETTGNYDTRAKIELSYSMIKGASTLALAKPCIKSYLYGHVRSPFLQINYEEWAMAAALPVQSFQKASERQVWADSRKKI